MLARTGSAYSSMKLENDRMEIMVRLLAGGKYTWTITLNSDTHDKRGSVEFLKSVDEYMKSQFPYPRTGSGRVEDID